MRICLHKKEPPNQVRGLRPKGTVDEKVSCWRSANHAALEADRRIRIGADHLAFRRYHGGARRSLRRRGWASCARCFAGTGVDTSAAVPTTDSRTFRFEFIINLTWLHHPCDRNSAYAVAYMPPSHHGFCVAKIYELLGVNADSRGRMCAFRDGRNRHGPARRTWFS